MTDGSFNRFINASLDVQVAAAEGHADGTGTAGLAAALLSPGIEIQAGLGALHRADGTIAVEIKVGGQRLGKTVVRNGLDGWMTAEQLRFRCTQILEQRQDALTWHQGTIQLRQWIRCHR